MRLEKIKLVGFKSFVDPTIVHFTKPLTGIVGPNGCGKSNIIDAVRWVMGESSAKQLRGESLVDVIFNGSTHRKPVGLASIELIFDNSKGMLGGEYAQYAQISIKREITRDATSNYYLNGARCRRRDITDVFLGTGMGPRSYSIIEQGMISELIEAKPDELRAYLEEVAGISRYKERRRETESRMTHTQENLSRVNDLRTELGKQLEHLSRQAKAAERYKILKEEERLIKAQLLALKWQVLETQAKGGKVSLNDYETQLASHHAALQHVNTETEKKLTEKTALSEIFSQAQTRYYGINSDIGRLEQEITHQKDRKQHHESELQQTQQSLMHLSATREQDQARKVVLEEAILQLTPQAELAQQQLLITTDALKDAESKMRDWQSYWDVFNQKASESTQQAKVEQLHIQHLEQRQLQLQQRLDKIRQELTVLNVNQYDADIESIRLKLADVEQQLKQTQGALESNQQQIIAQRDSNKLLDRELNETRNQLHHDRGHYASLEALQQTALGKKKTNLIQWLESKKLNHYPRLAELIQVETGWEKAVETVLKFYLGALCVDDQQSMDSLLSELASLDKESLIVLNPVRSSSEAILPKSDSLAVKVQTQANIQPLLNTIYTASSLEEAMRHRDQLLPHESVITADGVWMSASWIRIDRAQDEKFGVIQREQELRTFKERIAEKTRQMNELEQRLKESQQQLIQQEQAREEFQKQLTQQRTQAAQLNAQWQVQQAKISETQKRHAQLTQECTAHEQEMTQSEQELTGSRQRWQDALKLMEQQTQERNHWLQEKETIRAQVEQQRQQLHIHQTSQHQLALQLGSNKTQLAALQQAIERANHQVESFTTKENQLRALLSESLVPMEALKTRLEAALAERVISEKRLNEVKHQIDALNADIQALTDQHHALEQMIQQSRDQLEKERLKIREIEVKQANLTEQIAEMQFDLTALFNEIPAEATEASWTESLEKMNMRISRLGPINLAAIEEHQQLLERKTYLDAQYADLEEALSILRTAIHKIDQETRAKFKETFDTVNHNFQVLFPKVFGGGSAHLELTDQDLLSTGISVLARPPGKRVSHIHLLSGGEKALTAIALVFAMFQLNPAPFCMLDEVDAPLDDANVFRFCELVKEMSNSVQFIFISHNKLAMEMANQLTGVTMNEPGVSRIVAVDIDEAMAMANAG